MQQQHNVVSYEPAIAIVVTGDDTVGTLSPPDGWVDVKYLHVVEDRLKRGQEAEGQSFFLFELLGWMVLVGVGWCQNQDAQFYCITIFFLG